MVYVRLAREWVDGGRTYPAGDMVDVDAATLASLEASGVVAEADGSGGTSSPDGPWVGPTSDPDGPWVGPTSDPDGPWVGPTTDPDGPPQPASDPDFGEDESVAA